MAVFSRLAAMAALAPGIAMPAVCRAEGATATPQGLGYGPGPWMMGEWQGAMPVMGWGGGWLMAMAGTVIIVALLVLIFRTLSWPPRGAQPQEPRAAGRSSGLSVLDERYAKGDVNREEYLLKKRDLLGH